MVTPGTPENTSLNAKLDYAAVEIQKRLEVLVDLQGIGPGSVVNVNGTLTT